MTMEPEKNARSKPIDPNIQAAPAMPLRGERISGIALLPKSECEYEF
jgi:hypothetical protein